MSIGTPEDEAQRPTFLIGGSAYAQGGTTDKDRLSFDPDEDVIDIPPEEVQVLCAYETRYRETVDAEFKSVRYTYTVVTLLDEEYAQVSQAHTFVVGGEPFKYSHEDVLYGLGEVTVHQMWYRAVDDT